MMRRKVKQLVCRVIEVPAPQRSTHVGDVRRKHIPNVRSFASSSPPSPGWKYMLEQVAAGKISPVDAMQQMNTEQANTQVLESFANLDHTRQKRTGFPEAVFAEGKSPLQTAAILDDMAKNADPGSISAILATR